MQINGTQESDVIVFYSLTKPQPINQNNKQRKYGGK